MAAKNLNWSFNSGNILVANFLFLPRHIQNLDFYEIGSYEVQSFEGIKRKIYYEATYEKRIYVANFKEISCFWLDKDKYR